MFDIIILSMSRDSLTNEDGIMLVEAARRTVTDHLYGRQIAADPEMASRFSFNAGVFVTLTSGDRLRGCIGFPLPARYLHTALTEAAVAAATEDPRFSPVRAKDLAGITFEVTVLSEPEKIEVSSPDLYPSRIKVGRDGLIIRYGSRSGLLLPQVPLEYGWSEQEFLEHTCGKAGLPGDCWRRKGVEILKFSGTVFSETEPGGAVERRNP